MVIAFVNKLAYAFKWSGFRDHKLSPNPKSQPIQSFEVGRYIELFPHPGDDNRQ